MTEASHEWGERRKEKKEGVGDIRQSALFASAFPYRQRKILANQPPTHSIRPLNAFSVHRQAACDISLGPSDPASEVEPSVQWKAS